MGGASAVYCRLGVSDMSPFTRAVLHALALSAAQQAAMCQTPLSLPAWLESYPGAAPEVRTTSVLVRSTYTTAAATPVVVEHYRKLFETAGLRFQPNSDGIGLAIRGAADECDLLIQIRQRSGGTFVDVNCAAKSQASSYSAAKTVQVPSSDHARRVAELGIHPTYHDAPAPPLVWPQ